MRYAVLLDGNDWSAHAYPAGAFCVVMVDEDTGDIVGEQTITSHYSRNIPMGMVYLEDHTPFQPVLLSLYAESIEYGILYEDLTDLMNHLPVAQRLENDVNVALWENKIIKDFTAGRVADRWIKIITWACAIMIILVLVWAFVIVPRLPVP